MKKWKKYLIVWFALVLAVGIVWLLGGSKAPVRLDENVPEGGEMLSRGKNSDSAVISSPTESPGMEPTTAPTPTPVLTPKPEAVSAQQELAGVWVPYFSLEVPEHTQEAFEANFRSIADSAREKGLNALFVHVRPFSDSFYSSELYPWSHVLTGTQGTDPGYDPMAFMVDYTHSLGLEFHAWVNPLRIRTTQTPAALAPGNPYMELKADNPYYFMEWEGALYLDPAYPYVRSLIAKGAAEIAEKYPVDGIHFDDYFYPTQDPSLDSEAYELYTETAAQPLDLMSWRTANINALVAETYERVKEVRPEARFGIAPQGNIDNDKKMGADVAAWCAVPGYVDYICPQIYFGFQHPVLDYGTALVQWEAMEKYDGLDFYVGLALYKAGDKAQGEDWMEGDVISRQIQAARAAECNGVVLYSSAFLDVEQTRDEIRSAVETLAEAVEN